MKDLADFLRARCDEEQTEARQAGVRSVTWNERGTWWLEGVEHVVVGDEEAFCHPHNAAHIERHDPARVLADVEAKRGILDMYDQLTGIIRHPTSDISLQAARTEQLAVMRILKLISLPYATHQDYRAEWKP